MTGACGSLIQSDAYNETITYEAPGEGLQKDGKQYRIFFIVFRTDFTFEKTAERDFDTFMSSHPTLFIAEAWTYIWMKGMIESRVGSLSPIEALENIPFQILNLMTL